MLCCKHLWSGKLLAHCFISCPSLTLWIYGLASEVRSTRLLAHSRERWVVRDASPVSRLLNAVLGFYNLKLKLYEPEPTSQSPTVSAEATPRLNVIKEVQTVEACGLLWL